MTAVSEGPSVPQEEQPELIVVLAAEAVTALGAEVDLGQQLQAVLEAAPPVARLDRRLPRLRPLFDESTRRAQASDAEKLGSPAAESSVALLDAYYAVRGLDEGHDEVAHVLRALDVVAGAYVKPAAALPVSLNAMTPTAEEAPGATPDLSDEQLYRQAPPVGVGAEAANAQPGGGGADVRVVDVEGAWRLSHEDLRRDGALLAGTPSDSLGWRNHGTAVLGVLSSRADRTGTTGIAPDASVQVMTIFGDQMGSAAAISRAADALRPGDVLMVELHRPGPRSGLIGQFGYIPVEWWPDDYDAVRYAVQRGVIVLEAAGNGSQDLDDPLYDTPMTGFPATWRNPFRRGSRDSGSVLVGAGAPVQGANGSSWGPDRSRLDFSNYGSAVDVQGHGREVTTCGYGDRQGGPEDRWYTSHFSGTSSALPVVVGALSCAQGILSAGDGARLTPEQARAAFRATGSPQQAGSGAPVTQNIGNRPDIAALVLWARSGGGSGTTGGGSGQGGRGKGGARKFPKLEKNEFKDLVEAAHAGAPSAASLDQRVAALEDEVAVLRHFISPALRPEVAPSAATTAAAGDAPDLGEQVRARSAGRRKARGTSS